MKKYPNISERLTTQKPHGLCKICGQNKSNMFLVIQIDIFRGDDLVIPVHKDCCAGKKSVELLSILGFIKVE